MNRMVFRKDLRTIEIVVSLPGHGEALTARKVLLRPNRPADLLGEIRPPEDALGAAEWWRAELLADGWQQTLSYRTADGYEVVAGLRVLVDGRWATVRPFVGYARPGRWGLFRVQFDCGAEALCNYATMTHVAPPGAAKDPETLAA